MWPYHPELNLSHLTNKYLFTERIHYILSKYKNNSNKKTYKLYSQGI